MQELQGREAQLPAGNNDRRMQSKHWQKLISLAAVLALPIFVMSYFRGIFYHAYETPSELDRYLVLHTTMEMASVVVSFAVFTVAWYTYRQTHNRRDLFISLTFLLVGIIDFVHTFSYQGMPNFLGTNSPSTASTYWIFARLVAALGLFIAAFIDPRQPRWWLTPWVLLPLTLALAVGIILEETLRPSLIPPMFVPGLGQTPLKIGLEYLVIVLNLAAIIAYERLRSPRDRSLELLQMALVAGIFSEAAFTLYSSVSDTFNLLGHIYKVIAYYFILGALFVSSVKRPYDQLLSTQEELRELADRNAQLYHEADKHRTELERSFFMIGQALGSGSRIGEVQQTVVQSAMGILRATGALIALRQDPISRKLEVTARQGMATSFTSFDLDDSIAGEVVKTRSPRNLPDMEQYTYSSREDLGASGIRSVLSVPILHDDSCLGALEVFSDRPNAFDMHDVDLLMAFARQVAAALQNVSLFEKTKRVAETLQKSFLPAELPSAPGLEISYCYQAALAEADVGGDFYDVIHLPGGNLGLVMADVSGKGLHAAVYTAMGKYMLRAYALEMNSPARVLERLNDSIIEQLAETGEDSTIFITLFFGIVDPDSRELRYASAGHEPGLLQSANGSQIQQLNSTGTPLGLLPEMNYDEERITLDLGSTLVLFTDGVTDSRNPKGEFLEVQGLKRIMADLKGKTADEVRNGIYDAVVEFTGGHQRDDIALLIVRSMAQ